MARFIPNPEIAAAKRQQALDTLEAGVNAIQTSDDFKAHLRAQAAFHDYSFGNVMLIYSQRPDATRVAGFKTWLKLNRHVKKGAKGITIFVPMTKKYAVENAEGEDETRTKLFFGTGSVFDISDTDGEPLPEGPEWLRIDGDSHEALFEHVATVVRAGGISISETPKDIRPDGYFAPRTNEIWIKPTLSPNAKVGTLIHELAHASDDVLALESYTEHRGEAEALAEGVAYVVGQHFGLDTASESFVYVAKWAEKPEVLKAKLAQIQKVAARIINEVERAATEAPELAAAA